MRSCPKDKVVGKGHIWTSSTRTFVLKWCKSIILNFENSMVEPFGLVETLDVINAPR